MARQVKVLPAFSKAVGVRGQRPCGLSRLRQTQEGRKGFLRKAFRRGLRFRSGRSWARATGTQDPSSGGAGARWAPFSADRAGRRDFLGGPTVRRGLPQASLKPAPSARCPLAEATAVFQSAVPPLPGLPPVGRMRLVRCTFPSAAPGKVKVVERCSTPRKLLKKFDQNFYAASRFGSAFILPAGCASPAPAWPCPGSAPGSWGTPGSPWSPAPARSSTGRGSYAAGTAVLQNFPTGSRR